MGEAQGTVCRTGGAMTIVGTLGEDTGLKVCARWTAVNSPQKLRRRLLEHIGTIDLEDVSLRNIRTGLLTEAGNGRGKQGAIAIRAPIGRTDGRTIDVLANRRGRQRRSRWSFPARKREGDFP
jgi:hypothetical protein